MGIPSQIGACSPPRSHRSARGGRDPAPGAAERGRAANYSVVVSERLCVANPFLFFICLSKGML